MKRCWLVFVLGFLCYLSAPGSVSAQLLRVRVSVKVVLDADGQRPSSGYLHQDSDIAEEIGFANEILRTNGADWRLDLVEVLDAPGISQWFGPLSSETSFKVDLEREAEADPERYLWRLDAINIYLLEMDFGGWCSFPVGGEDIIVLGSQLYRDLAPDDPYPRENILFSIGSHWLHEIGHFFNLRHTHANACDPCTEACQPGDDAVADTLPDVECWTQDDIAQRAFGTNYAELAPNDQHRVDLTWKNVMSHHFDAILLDREAFLTPGQLGKTAAEMDPLWSGRRIGVVTKSCEVSGLPDKVELDCNRNGILDGCEPDCNRNGSPDDCDIALGAGTDCDLNGSLDECDVVPRDFGFAEPVPLDGALRPFTLVAADMDGDGHADLTSASTGSTDFMIFSGAGDGSFSAPNAYAAGQTSTGFVVCDLDGARGLDIVLTDAGTAFNPRNTLTLVLSSGARAFAEPVRFDVGLGPAGVACADLNGDGARDLVVANSRSDHLSVLWSLGEGNLAPAVDLAVGGGTLSVEALDLDADGDLDLVAWQSASESFSVLTNRGDKVFSEAMTVAPGFRARAIDVTDINQDGRPDLLAGDIAFMKSWILPGDGAGGFQAPSGHDFSTMALPAGGIADVMSEDMNGDGRPDIVMAAWSYPTFSVLLASGGDGFAGGQRIPSDGAPASLTAADFDEDGFFDLATASVETGAASVHLNSSAPPISPDCNRNELPDACDVASGRSQDADANGIPDECAPPGTPFRRGRVNDDAEVDISDAVAILGFLFLGSPESLTCDKAADVNDDGAIDLSDPVALLGHLFLGSAAPPEPFGGCWLDPTEDALGCESFGSCA